MAWSLTTMIVLGADPSLGSPSRCSSTKLAHTIYDLPKESQFRSRSAFMKDVRMQGSGIMNDGRVAHYNGKITRNECPRAAGDFTTKGAAGRCLIPFFSVAADLRKYHAGTLLKIPALAGKKITLPNGQVVTHPGYVMVDDTGGAIKGRGRFDFYTGTMRQNDPQNAFGSRGRQYAASSGNGVDLEMASQNACDKSFTAIDPRSPEWKTAMRFISSYSWIQDTLGQSVPLMRAAGIPASRSKRTAGIGG